MENPDNLGSSEILENAARIFLKKTYDKTTMEDISNELLMTKGSLYSYVKSKEDLLFQCHMKAIRMGNRDLVKTMNSDLSAEMKLREAIIRHVELITKEFVVGTLRQHEFMLVKPMREKVVKERDKFERNFLKVLRGATKTRHWSKDRTKMIAYTILGALHWIPRWYSATGKFSATQIGKIMADYLIGKISRDVKR
jgi:AcrR family transcriptional regulator